MSPPFDREANPVPESCNKAGEELGFEPGSVSSAAPVKQGYFHVVSARWWLTSPTSRGAWLPVLPLTFNTSWALPRSCFLEQTFLGLTWLGRSSSTGRTSYPGGEDRGIGGAAPGVCRAGGRPVPITARSSAVPPPGGLSTFCLHSGRLCASQPQRTLNAVTGVPKHRLPAKVVLFLFAARSCTHGQKRTGCGRTRRRSLTKQPCTAPRAGEPPARAPRSPTRPRGARRQHPGPRAVPPRLWSETGALLALASWRPRPGPGGRAEPGAGLSLPAGGPRALHRARPDGGGRTPVAMATARDRRLLSAGAPAEARARGSPSRPLVDSRLKPCAACGPCTPSRPGGQTAPGSRPRPPVRRGPGVRGGGCLCVCLLMKVGPMSSCPLTPPTRVRGLRVCTPVLGVISHPSL